MSSIPKDVAVSKSRSMTSSLALLAKPGIVAGTAMTALTGTMMMTGAWPITAAALVNLFAVALAAGGAAMLNGVLDERLDAFMPRLGARVAALGLVGKRKVIVCAVSAIASAIAIQLLFVNATAAALTLTAAISYALVYTIFLKRRSPYGTIPGGVPGALPALIGASAVGHVGAGPLLLALLMLVWQPPHFWALALKYEDEYRRAGLPVLPVERGARYTMILSTIYNAALAPFGAIFYLYGVCSLATSLIVIALGVVNAVACHSLMSKREYGRAFGASIAYISIVQLSLIIDALI